MWLQKSTSDDADMYTATSIRNIEMRQSIIQFNLSLSWRRITKELRQRMSYTFLKINEMRYLSLKRVGKKDEEPMKITKIFKKSYDTPQVHAFTFHFLNNPANLKFPQSDLPVLTDHMAW